MRNCVLSVLVLVGITQVRLVSQVPCSFPAAYGTASACTPGQPSLTTSGGFPIIGNAAFNYDIAAAPVTTPILWLFGYRQVSIPTPNGTLLVDPVLVLSGSTNASGVASIGVPVPNDASLIGGGFYAQAAPIDLAISAGFCLTNGVRATICHDTTPPNLNMVQIAAGSFRMGSTQGRPEELPVHTVHITRPFWIGKYEVTQAEYQAVMNTNPSFRKGANLPVETVSWNDAMAYCAALTVRERTAGRVPAGYQYRLPTEAEWEYCCRAGTTTEWNVGTSLSCSQANFWPSNPCMGQTSPVGSYAANPWGLYDTHGNVWEWCLDWWDGSANYPVGPVWDPYVTSGPNRVYRGGHWGVIAVSCRSAVRSWVIPSYRDYGLGFRVVLAPVIVQ